MFFWVNILENMDHGTVPAATKEIQKDLDINKGQLGLFGSLVFLGNFLGKIIIFKQGSMIFFTLISQFNRKYLLMICLILNAVCLYTFTVFNQYWFLCLNRVIVGIFQVNVFLIN